MNALSLTLVLIGICVGIILLVAMAKPIKLFLGIVLNAALGAGGILIANILMAPFGVALGINVLTLGFVGLLGLPGFCALILISSII